MRAALDQQRRGDEMMFRVIGGVVVYGFALYGVVKLLGRRKKMDTVEAANRQDHKPRSATAEPMHSSTSEQLASVDVDSTQAGG